MEHLHNSFRANGPGSDSVLVSKGLLMIAATGRTLFGGLEVQDSRAWLDDRQTPLGTDDVNVTEPLQAYIGMRFADVLQRGDRLRARVGRMTLDIGSRRLVARNRFRNTTNAFSGAHFEWRSPRDAVLHGFFTVPVHRLPVDGASLRGNDFQWDQERSEQVFWGLHLVDAPLSERLSSDWFLYGFREADRPSLQTRNRDLITAGFALRSSFLGLRWEMEAALQTGHSRASADPTDRNDLTHRAWFSHLAATQVFDARWRPTVTLRFDYASGDRDPADGRFEGYDTLFGARRFEYGPTGIFGALARTNIVSPGIRVALDFRPDLRANMDYRAVWLASDQGALATAGLLDLAGDSGRFVGHQVDVRARWTLLQGSLELELGGAYLTEGDFLRNAPQASLNGDSVYAYAQARVTF